MTPSTPSGGTQITAWRDKSVNGVSYASGAVPTYPGCNITPPTYVAGGGINFNPSIPGGGTFTNNVTQGLSAVGGFPLNATGFTAFAVAVATGTMTTFNSYFSYAAGAPQFIDFDAGGSTRGQIITDTTGLNVTISGTVLTTTRQIQSVRSSTTGATFFVNGSLSNTTAFNYTQVNNPLATVVWIGNQAPGFRSFSGTIFELLVYNQSLSSNQRQIVEGYLARKWAISFAFNHPFSTSPPFNRYFNPTDVPGCSLWLDGADGRSVTTAPTYAANLGVVTTLAGSNGGFADGTGVAANFSNPHGVDVIPSSGAIVVGDTQNNRIRLITTSTYAAESGVVTTLAGSGTAAFADGTGAAASFSGPWGVAVIPSSGVIVVADRNNNRIRLVTPGGVVTTLAGSNTASFADGTGTAARFANPTGVAVYPTGHVVVADQGNNRIRLISPLGVVTTLAGQATAGFADGTGASASFNGPIGVAVIPSTGNIVVGDSGNNRIRLVTPGGVVTTLAGQATAGSNDGTGAAASFNLLRGVAVTSTGAIVVSDYNNNRIRLVTTSTYAANSGVVTTLAGSTFGFLDGTGAAARFWVPSAVAVNPSNGVIAVADMLNNRIRLVTTSSINTTWGDKSGSNNNVTGTATWTGSNVSFNGSTNAFSNTTYVFPISNYSMFGVYSNTTAPAAGAYMNAVYGSNGFPMLGTFGPSRFVSVRSVVANTGALSLPASGWAARISTGSGSFNFAFAGGRSATDPGGNVIVAGFYDSGLTLFNANGTSGGTLPYNNIAIYDIFVVKYTSAGAVSWGTRINCANVNFGVDASGVATDSASNVLVIGSYVVYEDGTFTLNLFNASGTVGATLPINGYLSHSFIVKYTSAGAVSWATRVRSDGLASGASISTDSSASVLVIGIYSSTLTLFNTGGATAATLGDPGSLGYFIAKYTSAGALSWATRITTNGTAGLGSSMIATDSSGNVIVSGLSYDQSPLTLYNANGSVGATLVPSARCGFIAKYTSAGVVSWVADITNSLPLAIAVDPSGNVVVTGDYDSPLTLDNANGTVGATLSVIGSQSCFIAKYTSAGAVSWATRIVDLSGGTVIVSRISTDSRGDIVTSGGYYSPLTLYNANGTIGTTTSMIGDGGCFIAKYTSAGYVSWVAQIAGSAGGSDFSTVSTDSSRNVLVTAAYAISSFIPYNADGTTSGLTLPDSGGWSSFILKYSPDGDIVITPPPASSNVLVSATYSPSTLLPAANGRVFSSLAGTTLATTGIFVGGPSNYFNGTISELLIYSATLTAAQRQQVEGYLIDKWSLRAQTVVGHQYRLIPPATSQPPRYNEVQPLDTQLYWRPALDRYTALFSNSNASSAGGVQITGTWTFMWSPGILSPIGRVYAPSYAAANSVLNVGFGTTIASGTPTWMCSALAPDGNIYCAPNGGGTNMLVINTTANTVSFLGQSFGGFQVSRLAPNGNIYAFSAAASSNLLIFNPVTQVARYANYSPAANYASAVLAFDGNIYLWPQFAGNAVYRFNPNTLSMTAVAVVSNGQRSASLHPSGWIYGFPTDGIMTAYNPASGITSNTNTGFNLSTFNVSQWACLGPDGNMYFTLNGAAGWYILTSNGTCTGYNSRAAVGYTANHRLSGGVLVNGTIYFPPFSTVGAAHQLTTAIISFPVGLPTDICLSPYYNGH